MQKDLRAVLGLPVAGPFSRGYCGHGDLAACRADLVATLDDAVAALEARFGGDPAGWDADEDADPIVFATVGIQGQRAMDWQNRPTFQQVVEFGPRPR